MAAALSNADYTEFPPPARLMSISVHAGEVFANQEKAIHWLRIAESFPQRADAP